MTSGKKRSRASRQTIEHTDQLVSVIMPVHNSEKFLPYAIESVIEQTYPTWELLIIDDNSKDGSLAIARQYEQKDSRIRVFVNDHPIGIPSAPRNVGIRNARGRFIAFLDSDDLWFHQKLEQQLPFFKDNRTAIVYSNYEKIDENGVRANRMVIAPSRATYNSLLKGNIIGNLTGVYDTRKVGKALMPDVRHEDYAMWLSILKQGYIARNTDTTLAAYREVSGSVSSNKLKVSSWQWNIYRNVERLSFLRSAYYFMFYAYKAFYKSQI